MMLSYFRKPISNTTPLKSVSVEEVYNIIKTEFVNETKELRTIPDKNEKAAFKTNNFDFVLFSGTFKKRSISDVDNYNGLVVIDIDGLDDAKKISDQIKSDPYIYLSFISPSGKGLKAVFFTDNTKVEKHKQYFIAIKQYFLDKYKIVIDKSGSDISRACFLCHDVDVTFNKRPTIWKEFVNDNVRKVDEVDYKDYKNIDLDKYNLKDCGSYYTGTCPKCNKKDLYLFKDGYILTCSHKSCGFTENILDKRVEQKINTFKDNVNDSNTRKQIYLLLAKMDVIEREQNFKKIGKILDVGITVIKNDYENTVRKKLDNSYRVDDFTFNNPHGWQVDESGITYEGKKKISNVPMYINSLGKDPITNKEYVEIKFGKGIKKSRKVTMKTICISKDLMEESDFGAPVNSANALELIKFFHDWLDVNRGIFPNFEVVTQLGWRKDRFILPERIVDVEETSKNIQYIGNIRQDAYREKGDLDTWVKTIKKLGNLKRGHVVRFMIYAGFASIIVEPLKLRSFIIHLHGDSSLGKTTSLKMVASIFGKPKEAYTMTRWKNTQNFIIRYLEQLKNLPLIIDELSSESKDSFDNILYMFEGGVSKGKASKNDANAFEPQRTFTTGMFSSGEPPIIGHQSYTGAKVRTWEFSGNPFKEINKELIQEIEETIKDNYGVALDKFIKSFLKNKNVVYNEEEKNFCDLEVNSNIEQRLLKPINMIAKTGYLVNELFGFDWDVKSDITEIFSYLKEKFQAIDESGKFSQTTEGFMEEIRGEYSENIDKFFVVSQEPGSGRNITKNETKNMWGFKFGTDLAWIKTSFIKLFNLKRKSGNGGKYLLNILEEEEIIPKRKQKNINGVKINLVYFDDFFENEDGENAELPF